MGQFIRLDKIKGSAHIETVVHSEDLKNGQFVELGVVDEALGGEAVAIEKTAKGARPEALIATVHIGYGHPDFDELNAVTKAGKAGRAIILEKGDVVSFADDLVAAGLEVGSDVAVGVNGLGIKKAELEEEVIGKVISKDYMANVGDLIVVRFK